MIGETLSDWAAVSSEGIKAQVGDVLGLNMITARLSPGVRTTLAVAPMSTRSMSTPFMQMMSSATVLRMKLGRWKA
jgi:hypothetical protein